MWMYGIGKSNFAGDIDNFILILHHLREREESTMMT